MQSVTAQARHLEPSWGIVGTKYLVGRHGRCGAAADNLGPGSHVGRQARHGGDQAGSGGYRAGLSRGTRPGPRRRLRLRQTAP